MSETGPPARNARTLAIVLLTLAVVLAVLVLPPVPQPAQYHNFADQRAFLGIPHFLNLVSNAAFLLAGGLALRGLLRGGAAFVHSRERWPYAVFFLGILLVGLGSGYYHLAPGNDRLFWDRLPLSLAFMSLLSAVLVERLGVRAGLRLFPWLAAAGPLSVLYWILTERAGAGDLRFYGLVGVAHAPAAPPGPGCRPPILYAGVMSFSMLDFPSPAIHVRASRSSPACR